MSTVERAVAIAAEAHRGQTTRLGEPYIMHPIRVMLRVRDDDQRQVAALHDVVERTPWTLDQLRAEGFTERVLDAVVALTRKEGEDYMDFVRRAIANPLARPVKKADLLDNADEARRQKSTKKTRARLEKYETALRATAQDGGAPGVADDPLPAAEGSPSRRKRAAHGRALLYLPAPVAVRLLALGYIRRARRAHRKFSKSADAEQLHDLRVAVRKLRSLLRVYADQLKGDVRRRDRRRLRNVAAGTRALRDIDVRLALLEKAPDDQGPAAERLRAHNSAAREPAVTRVSELLDDDRGRTLRRLRRKLRRITLELSPKRPEVGPTFAVVLADVITQLRQELVRRLENAAETQDDSRIHAARIAAKRLRYALEPVAATAAGAAAIAELTTLQGLTGRCRDVGDAIVDMDRERAHAHREDDEQLVESVVALLATARAERDQLLERIRAEWLKEAGSRRLAPLDRVIEETLVAAREWRPPEDAAPPAAAPASGAPDRTPPRRRAPRPKPPRRSKRSSSGT